jgi:nitric oxide synthase oxygenase domain/subunit
LVIRDCRQVTTVQEMFTEICIDIKDSSNNGIIIPMISVFPERKSGCHDQLRVWNAQLIQYAGYASTEDHKVVIGDKVNVAFTTVCKDMQLCRFPVS